MLLTRRLHGGHPCHPSGWFLNDATVRTSLFRNFFFVRISNIWDASRIDFNSESNVNSFKKMLKTFYFTRLQMEFDPDDTRTVLT